MPTMQTKVKAFQQSLTQRHTFVILIWHEKNKDKLNVLIAGGCFPQLKEEKCCRLFQGAVAIEVDWHVCCQWLTHPDCKTGLMEAKGLSLSLLCSCTARNLLYRLKIGWRENSTFTVYHSWICKNSMLSQALTEWPLWFLLIFLG